MKMSETIANGASGKSAMIDVYYWLTRATLDGLVKHAPLYLLRVFYYS
jgi:hypothetical protein